MKKLEQIMELADEIKRLKSEFYPLSTSLYGVKCGYDDFLVDFENRECILTTYREEARRRDFGTLWAYKEDYKYLLENIIKNNIEYKINSFLENCSFSLKFKLNNLSTGCWKTFFFTTKINLQEIEQEILAEMEQE